MGAGGANPYLSVRLGCTLVYAHDRQSIRDNRTLKLLLLLLRIAALRDVRLHDLRHTAASLLLAQGVLPRVVMEILGHSEIALTMNTYTHVAGELTRAATGRMADALWPERPEEPGSATGQTGEPA